MTKLSVNGNITKILPIEKGTSKAGKPYSKMGFVINTSADFNPEIYFQIFGDEKCENFAKYNKEGDYVNVFFNVSSREWEGKYYTSVDCWRCEKVTSEAPSDTAPPAHPTTWRTACP